MKLQERYRPVDIRGIDPCGVASDLVEKRLLARCRSRPKNDLVDC